MTKLFDRGRKFVGGFHKGIKDESPVEDCDLDRSDRTVDTCDDEDDVDPCTSEFEVTSGIPSGVFLFTPTGVPYHLSERCCPKQSTPAWKRICKASVQEPTKGHHARFIDEEFGLLPQQVVTEVRIRPRTLEDDIPSLFYTEQDIERFRLAERIWKIGQTVAVKTGDDGDNSLREDAKSDPELYIMNSSEESPMKVFKCVGFIDRADGRQGSTLVTETYTRPYTTEGE